MEKKERNLNFYLSVILPIGFTVLVLSIYRFPTEKINAGLIALSAVTVFFSSYLQIQLPRTKIHLTISDALIMLSLLIYGGEIAVVLSALESCYTSLNMRRKGISIRTKTIAFNIAIASISTFLTSTVVNYIFGSSENAVKLGNENISVFIGLMTVMVLTQFVVNSICVALFTAIKSGKSLWTVWNEYCLNALVMFITGAFLAGAAVKTLSQINVILLAVVVGFFAVVYMTYRRYVNDVKTTSEKAEQAERERAEQAERHIVELEHHIAEQERISQALRESKERFRHAALHDALTDLPNRNFFVETVNRLLEKRREDADAHFAVLFLDLNRFKTVNESLGHLTGNELLQIIGKRLKRLVTEADLLARFGGDEFGIILSNVKNSDEVICFAKLITHQFTSPFTVSERQIFINTSIGIALADDLYENADEILRDADIAMYHAKDNKKDFEIFDEMMRARAVSLLQIETDLRYAIERGEFRAFYQPIVNLDTLQLSGFETLIRWQHPQRGMIFPNEFIPVSEETGLIVPITYWILEESCRQIVAWQKSAPVNKDLFISVNLSGKHFAHVDLVESIQKIIVKTGIAPEHLKLEITESAVMENPEQTIMMLKRLKKLGVQLSIDDFGTGYSSLNYLHRFPIDTLKIDRSFVSTIENGTENGEIVRTIIALAKALNLDVIAEGIETIHQLRQLRILGCQNGQGYLFARPVAVEEAAAIVADNLRWQDIIPGGAPIVAQKHEFPHLRLAK